MKQPRQRDEKHLQFLRSLPCLVCQNNISTEAAHIRMSDASVGKFNPGVGAKPSDMYAVPLCGDCHREQHAVGNERRYWEGKGIDPIEIAKQLYAVSGDHEAGCRIVMNARPINIMAAK